MSGNISNAMKAGLTAFIKRKAEYDAKAEKGPYGYIEDFAQLRQKTLQYREERTFNYAEGEKPFNYRKNRYKDILPYDFTRVILNKLNDMPGTDYINANFIKGPGDKICYIAAQGPLHNTVKDFWRMLWEKKTEIVLMACSEFEGDPPKHKCERYWPNSTDEVLKFDQISVSLEKEFETDFPDYKIRYLRVESAREVHRIYQFQYVGWPDHGVPSAVTGILDMMERSRGYQQDDIVPQVVHCSAGCGRTGTIMAIDYVWRLMNSGKIGTDFDLYSIIHDMRTQRPSLVQSLDQYRFVFEAVVELFERQLDKVKKHAYENVELGAPLIPGLNPPPSNKHVNSPENLMDEDIGSKTSDSGKPKVSPRSSLAAPEKPEATKKLSETNAKPNKPSKPEIFKQTSNVKPKPNLVKQTSTGSGKLENSSVVRESCIPTNPINDMIARFSPESSESQAALEKPADIAEKPMKPTQKPQVKIAQKPTPTKPMHNFSEISQQKPAEKSKQKPRPAQEVYANVEVNFDSYSTVVLEPGSDVPGIPPGKHPAFGVLPVERVDNDKDYSLAFDDDGSDSETDDTYAIATSDDKMDAYAYANPNKTDKWSLQHYAFPGGVAAKQKTGAPKPAAGDSSYMEIDICGEPGKAKVPQMRLPPSGNPYAEVDLTNHHDEDDDGDSDSDFDDDDDDEEAPEVPRKAPNILLPETAPNTGTLGKTSGISRFKGILKFNKHSTPEVSDSAISEAREIQHKMAMPKRLKRPKGPRPMAKV